MIGKLYIIGIGPGDPDLLTLKAARVLGAVSQVFVPVSKAGKQSVAYQIAQTHIKDPTAVRELVFPMLKNREALPKFYESNRDSIVSVLKQGRDAALITLGDPGTYSTAWFVYCLIRQQSPEVPVEIIPGITSFAHAAACTGTSLAQGNEVLSVVSSYDSLERIEGIVAQSDTVVFLKTYRNRVRLLERLEDLGVLEQCTYIKRCGLEGEQVIEDLRKLSDDPDYLSMIILRKQPRAEERSCEPGTQRQEA